MILNFNEGNLNKGMHNTHTMITTFQDPLGPGGNGLDPFVKGEGGTPIVDTQLTLNGKISKFLQGDLTIGELLDYLNEMEIELKSYDKVANDGYYNVVFTYKGKEYSLKCEKTAGEKSNDGKKNASIFTPEDFKMYGFDDEIIKKYFTEVGSVNGTPSYFIFNETAKNENITSLKDLHDHLYGKTMDELILSNFLNNKDLTTYKDTEITDKNWAEYDQDIDKLIADNDYNKKQEKALNKFLEEFLAGKLDKDTAMQVLSAIIGSEPKITAMTTQSGGHRVNDGWRVTFNFNGKDYDLYLLEDFAKNDNKDSNKLFDAIAISILAGKYPGIPILDYFEVVAQSTESTITTPIAYRLKPGLEDAFNELIKNPQVNVDIDSLIFDPYKENNTTATTGDVENPDPADKTDNEENIDDPKTNNGRVPYTTELITSVDLGDLKNFPFLNFSSENDVIIVKPKDDNGDKTTDVDNEVDKPTTNEPEDPVDPQPQETTLSKEQKYNIAEDFYYNAVKNDFKEALGDCETAIVTKNNNGDLGLRNLAQEDLDEAFFTYFYSVINSNGTISREDAKQIFDKALNEILKDFKLGDQLTLDQIYDLFCEYLNEEFKIVPATDEELGQHFCDNANFEDFKGKFNKKVQNYPLIISKNNDGTSITSTNGETEITNDVYDYFKRLLENLPHADDNNRLEDLFKKIMKAIPEGVYSLEDLFNYILEAVRTEILHEGSEKPEDADNNNQGSGSTNNNTADFPVDNNTTGGTTGSTSEDSKYSDYYNYFLENGQYTFDDETDIDIDREIELNLGESGTAQLKIIHNGNRVDVDNLFEQYFIKHCCSDQDKLTDAEKEEIANKVNEILADIIKELGVGTKCSIKTLFEKFIEKINEELDKKSV